MLSPTKTIEIWGGIECSINRIEQHYYDQLERSGHLHRSTDLDNIAALGIRTLRYPLLWEQLAKTDNVENIDWSWSDSRLRHLQKLRITPVLGLLHHGSGPAFTHLLAENFAESFARYAAAVARRYPWVDYYCPINEPLTTARFSGLYGLWYPHGRDDRSFVQALLNQCRAIILAMRAIRGINPRAKLIQTEDLGRTYSRSALRYQAVFDNHRRWLSWDLLHGSINDTHPLWNYLLDAGADREMLRWFIRNPCPPDVLGINHYITSDRYLDERLELYPELLAGSNHRQRYIDIEAIRVLPTGRARFDDRIAEVWQRYRRPLALTEVHMGCSREEQLRWLYQAWKSAQRMRLKGVAIKAITPWALFGSFNWNTLLTIDTGYYEPGAFDVRSGTPRRTAIAQLIETLAGSADTDFHRQWVRRPGWWQRHSRLVHSANITRSVREKRSRHRPLLAITGANGTLGQAFIRLCSVRGLSVTALTRTEMDITCFSTVQDVLNKLRPWAVVNAAGYVRVDQAETDCSRCQSENVLGACNLAQYCSDTARPLLTFSSDLVFDGKKAAPYDETSTPNPLSVYGRTKATAEKKIATLHTDALQIRTSAFFGPWDNTNFVTQTLRTLGRGEIVQAACDVRISPTYVPDLVNTSLDLLLDGAAGIWHLNNQGASSWADFAQLAAQLAKIPTARLQAVEQHCLPWRAPRPSNSSMTSIHGVLLPSLVDALQRYTIAMN
jgi:dTDP-4-dehydrorhamnose reductase